MQNIKDTRRKACKYGLQAEKLVKNYMQNSAYKILAERYKTPHGELDIIAEDKANQRLIFVEVKARRSRSRQNNTATYSDEREHIYSSIITQKQIARNSDAASIFISQHEEQYAQYFIRFDLIIVLNGEIHDHIEGAW